MKKIVTASLLSAALCGCLSPKVPQVSYWLLDFRGEPSGETTPKYGSARLSQIAVNMPYAGDRMVVLKQDGTVAFDAQNVFAASPAALLKGTCMEAMRNSGVFTDVVGATSGMATAVSTEVVVRRLALDCRREGVRKAIAEVQFRLIEGRKQVVSAVGSGESDAADGDYGAAFSKALSQALSRALDGLR